MSKESKEKKRCTVHIMQELIDGVIAISGSERFLSGYLNIALRNQLLYDNYFKKENENSEPQKGSQETLEDKYEDKEGNRILVFREREKSK